MMHRQPDIKTKFHRFYMLT